MSAKDKQIALRIQTIFFMVLAVAFLSVYALNYILGLFPQEMSGDINMLLEVYRSSINPEPIERAIFLILVPALFTLILFLAKYQTCLDNNFKLVAVVFPLLLPFILLYPLHRSNILHLLVSNTPFLVKHDYAIWLISLSFAMLCSLIIRKFQFWETSKAARTMAWTTFIMAMLIHLFSWRITTLNTASTQGNHAEVLFYSLSQVLGGKTILVDLPSQYGLFPELLYPIFKLFRPSVLALSKLFAFLQITSLLSLFYVLARLVKNSILLLLGGISLIFITYATFLYFLDYPEPYYQYFPIRFFWPAFSVLVFYYFSSNKTLLRGALVSLVSAIGIFWNLDTGLFIFLSFAVYLSTQIIILGLRNKTNRWLSIRKYIAVVALHLLITITVIGLLLGVMWFKAQQPLQLQWLFAYQKFFYGMGFYMIPMPQNIDPWMSVLSIYTLGIILSLTTWFQRWEEDIHLDMILFLSLLGMGLFVYYQGRSHPFNLIHVCWPAVLIITIAADLILKKIQERNLLLTYIALPIAAIAFLSICSINFFAHMPKMLRDITHLYKTRKAKPYPLIQEEIAFVQSHARTNHECFILSQRQSIYYLESGLASPLKGPGVGEIFLQADQDRLMSKLLQGRIDCIFFGITPYSNAPYVPYYEEKLRKIYNVAAENTSRTMLYLTPKFNAGT